MYEIERVLDELSEKTSEGMILIVKATEGYSAVHVTRDEYNSKFIMKDHYNAATVVTAIQDLYSDF